MSEPSLQDYLEDMERYGGKVHEFCKGLTEEALERDERTRFAVERLLEIVGEASAKVVARHPRFVERHPEVPWRDMAGMRNRLAHAYRSIRLRLVWEAATVSIPELEQKMPGLRLDAAAYERSRGPAL
jgi:uncharacterized protein with HEPN domain